MYFENLDLTEALFERMKKVNYDFVFTIGSRISSAFTIRYQQAFTDLVRFESPDMETNIGANSNSLWVGEHLD